ncbi:MAG TPA: PAS domain-containing protein, partial [Chitinophagaceae bacterium]|nr:PAS domain-containing protein [Chitinophagaceae bacterium]
MRSSIHPSPGALPGLAVANAYTLIAVVYCSSFSLLYYFVAANTFLAVVHLLALLGVTANYIILKRTGNFERTNIIMTIGTVVVVCMFASGGWEKTGFLWPFVFLPFVFFLAEPGKSIYWVIGLVAGCAASAMLQFSGVIDRPYSGIAVLNFFACLTVFMACNYFVKQKAINYKEMLDYTRSLLDSSIDPFFIIGTDGTIKDINTITERILGVPYSSITGSRFAAHFMDQDSAGKMCDEVFAKGTVVNYPLAMLRDEAEPVELLFNAVLYRDENGKVQGVFAVGRDITERRKQEMQLRRFNEELEAQVHIKTKRLAQKATELEQFAYLASHDLQEPLNTTSGFIRLLKKKYEGKLDKEADVYFSFIAQAS